MQWVYDSYQAPFGTIHILMDQTGLTRVAMTVDQWNNLNSKLGEIGRDQEYCRQAITELDEYFRGNRRNFSVPLSTQGPPFSEQVWWELLRIPFGETRSYGDIARAIGRPNNCRAVGQANRRNPLPIFIPCHRVIGKDGGLTGYMGKQGLRIKEYLLEMERSKK